MIINRWLGIQNGGFISKTKGVLAVEDITRAIQLLNGIGSFRAWSGFELGPKP